VVAGTPPGSIRQIGIESRNDPYWRFNIPFSGQRRSPGGLDEIP